MELISTFAERLGTYMQHYKITYDNLSKITRCPAQTLNRYVLGQRIPKINDFCQIALALEIDPLWLQGFDVDSPFDISSNYLPMSNELWEVAKAYEKADIKSKNIARQALDLPTLETPAPTTQDKVG